MKRTIGLVALAACAIACGDADLGLDPDGDGFRSSESAGFDVTITAEEDATPGDVEKILMPNSYGHENGFTKCSNPFNGTCMVPDIRSFAITVDKYTCSTQQFKDQTSTRPITWPWWETLTAGASPSSPTDSHRPRRPRIDTSSAPTTARPGRAA